MAGEVLDAAIGHRNWCWSPEMIGRISHKEVKLIQWLDPRGINQLQDPRGINQLQEPRGIIRWLDPRDIKSHHAAVPGQSQGVHVMMTTIRVLGQEARTSDTVRRLDLVAPRKHRDGRGVPPATGSTQDKKFSLAVRDDRDDRMVNGTASK